MLCKETKERRKKVNEKYLPIGSVVRLKGAEKSLMITGFLPIETEKKDDDYILYEMKYPKNNSSWLKMLINIKEITKIIEYYGRANIKAIIMMDYFSVALYRINKYCKNNNIKIIADTVDWFEKSNYNFPKNIIKNF